jgi:hypothetical protein
MSSERGLDIMLSVALGEEYGVRPIKCVIYGEQSSCYDARHRCQAGGSDTEGLTSQREQSPV